MTRAPANGGVGLKEGTAPDGPRHSWLQGKGTIACKAAKGGACWRGGGTVAANLAGKAAAAKLPELRKISISGQIAAMGDFLRSRGGDGAHCISL